jgi:HD-GYP domain-containing protein (c-di-GMP phosphodiesterase class II)
MVVQMNKDLIPVSITLLYDGITAPHDIYDADAKRLLIRQGHTLRLSQIEAIQRFNKGKDTIHVSSETHKMLMANKAAPANNKPSDIEPHKQKLEKESGYSDLKHETVDMIREIGLSETAPREKIHTLSRSLSDKIDTLKPDVILDIINTLAPSDEYLQRHCVNVSFLNGLLGKWLGLPKDTIDTLVLVGLVHDCGKASIPSQILNAPRKLTISEFEVIKMHPVFGYEILSEFSDEVRYGVRGHHEKFGSKGYPDGRMGDDIPLIAKVTAVSDIYDAMVSQRSYKTPRNPFSIISWLRNLRVTELDKTVVDVFIQNMPNEMLGKSASLSDGSIGIIHKIDYGELEYPYIRIGEKVMKSNQDLYCTQIILSEMNKDIFSSAQ